MIWLIYGSKGWIGGQIKEILIQQGETVVDGLSRADNFYDTITEIENIKPDRIICTLGRTSGKNCLNIDYLESPEHSSENLRDNLHAPLNLAIISQQLHIHLTYLGTGCVYAYDQKHPMENYTGRGFTEEDKPNFRGSQYSQVKGVTDCLIRHFDTTLNARIRMPISAEMHPRNFVTKITHYPKVISIPNSMTVLPELLPLLVDMSKRKITGTINLTNPGAITHGEILDMYKLYIDPDRKSVV